MYMVFQNDSWKLADIKPVAPWIIFSYVYDYTAEKGVRSPEVAFPVVPVAKDEAKGGGGIGLYFPTQENGSVWRLAQWDGSYTFKENQLCFSVEAPEVGGEYLNGWGRMRHRHVGQKSLTVDGRVLGIGYFVRLLNGTFDDGSVEKEIILQKIQMGVTEWKLIERYPNCFHVQPKTR